MRQRESHAESARNGAVATSGIVCGTTTTTAAATTMTTTSSTTVANNAHHARAAQHHRCRIDLALVQAVSAQKATESWPYTTTGSALVTTTPVEAYHGLMEVSTLVSPLIVFILLINLYCTSVACAPWAFFLLHVLY
jgi:hypothetical protein